MSISTYNQPDVQPRTTDSPRRAVLAALGLLFAATIPSLTIVEGFKLVQAQLGYGGDLAVTYIGGGLLATITIGLIGVAYHRVRPVTVHVPRWLPKLRESGWIVAGVVISFVAAILIGIGIQLLSVIEETYAAIGSGRQVAYGILDAEASPSVKMTEARRIVGRAIQSAAERDAQTGVGVYVAEISGDGVDLQKYDSVKVLKQ